MRTSGILLPAASLPGNYGIGGFSEEAFCFADFLAEAGQSWWQILPLGPTGYGDSPYQSFSTFAGNPYYISLDGLVKEGLLTAAEAAEADCGQYPVRWITRESGRPDLRHFEERMRASCRMRHTQPFAGTTGTGSKTTVSIA